jgi:hypothetical protein
LQKEIEFAIFFDSGEQMKQQQKDELVFWPEICVSVASLPRPATENSKCTAKSFYLHNVAKDKSFFVE